MSAAAAENTTAVEKETTLSALTRGHYTYDRDPDARPTRLRSADGREKLDRHHHGQHSRQRHHHHHRRQHSGAGGSSGNGFAEAATAAAAADLVEAVRARHNPDRSILAIRAAVGAADTLVNKGED